MEINTDLIKGYDAGSRELEIQLKGNDGIHKSFRTPSYFPTIARVGDMRDVMDAKIKLENMDVTDNLSHIKGLIVEANSIPRVLTRQLKLTRQTRLFEREKGEQFSHFYDFLDEYGLVFIIDPNLDRIEIFSTYGADFEKLHEQYSLPKRQDKQNKFFTPQIYSKLLNKEPINPRLFLNPEFITQTLGLQLRYRADILLPPYSEINLRNFSEDLSTNLELFHSASQINKFVFGNEKPLIPVMCLHTNIFRGGNKKQETGMKKGKTYWEDLIDSFTGIDSDILILKITNFNTSSKNEEYRKILMFFRELKEKIAKPIMFLNMNEFAYILLRYGLDVYSSRMSRSGIDIPRPSMEKPPPHGKYYVPRKMELVNFEDLPELPCSCPFCSPYENGAHKKLPPLDWNSLRIYHFVHTKNEELDGLLKEMKKNSLRAALAEMFADSESWKNFTSYI